MLRIGDIKANQIFYSMTDNGEPYKFKAWGDPYLNDEAVLIIEAEDDGNYGYTFSEEDESILFLTDNLE